MNITNNFNLIYTTKRQKSVKQNVTASEKEITNNKIAFKGVYPFYKNKFVKYSNISKLYTELKNINSLSETPDSIRNFITELITNNKDLFTRKDRQAVTNILAETINDDNKSQELREFLVDVYAHTFRSQENLEFLLETIDTNLNKNLDKNNDLVVKTIEAVSEYFNTTKIITNRKTYHVNNSDLQQKISKLAGNKDSQIQKAANKALERFNPNNTIDRILEAENKSKSKKVQSYEGHDRKNELNKTFSCYRKKSRPN